MADNVLKQGVESVSELINVPSFINLDFADVRSVMKDAGYAHMGVGRASGPNKAEEAAMMAIQSPLLETSIDSARGVIISITSSPDIGLDEVDQAATLITSSADPEANIIWGAAFDTNLVDEMKITVIATGFESNVKKPEAKPVEEAKSQLGINNWFDDNNKGHISPADDDDYLNDVISILKKNSSK